jgi:hypothetical protein
VVSCWILLELLISAQLTRLDKSQQLPHSFLKFYLGWQAVNRGSIRAPLIGVSENLLHRKPDFREGYI